MGMRSTPGSEISFGNEVWFPWQPGDKIQRADHTPERGLYWLVTAVGESYFLAKTFSPHQSVYEERQPKDAGWLAYVEPTVYPERWMNIYPDDVGFDQTTLLACNEQRKRDGTRIGILHLRPDGTTEMLVP